jgi:5-methylcytosine-specific restriction endonuclease McrA
MASTNWTQGRVNAFIMSVLRSGTRRWPPKWEVLEAAKTDKHINPATGRLAQFYRCAECNEEQTSKNMEVDHILPVVPPTGFVSWDNVIERLFCGPENLQVLCVPCHKAKSKEEQQIRKKSETKRTNSK